VAWLAIPIVAARWLRHRDMDPEMQGMIARGAFATYSAIMRPALKMPWLILLLVIPFLAYGYYEYTHVKSGLMPVVDEGGFVIDYVGPPGASIAEMDRLMGNVEAILRDTPEVTAYSRRTGFSLGGDIMESNMGDFFVRLKPLPRRPIFEIMKEVHDRVGQTTAGFEQFEPKQLMEDLLGDLSGKPQPIVVNLYSDDEKTLTDLAPKVADAVGKIQGVTDVDPGITPAGDALSVQVDRVKASIEGVDPDTVTKELTAALTGTVSTQIQEGPKMVDVRLWIPSGYFKTSDDLEKISLRAPDGHLFPLKRVAKIGVIQGQPEINRDNLKRVVWVTGQIDETSGRDLGSVIVDVRKLLQTPGMIPDGVRWSLGGQYEQQQLAFAGSVRVIVAAAALVYVLLLFLYERFRVATAIMFTTVLAVAAVFIGLRWTNTELNITSLMGMLMIVGNVTEVAIFYYSEYADFLTNGTDIDRLIEAGNYRMRAILMTTIAAILALLPLALGNGMLQPLAIAIITGLVVQLPLVLIFLPSFLRILRVHR
jgi:multidrug efflux pump subunit AcrB